MKKIICTILTLVMVFSLVVPVSATSGHTNNANEARYGTVRFFCGEFTDGTAWVGSGFAIGEAGQPAYIFATNHHVVEGADIVYILLDDLWALSVPELGGVDDSVHAVRCEVIYDHTGGPDYAIVRTKRLITERVALPLMRSHLAVPGDTVYALGYPGVSDEVTDTTVASVDSMTVTKGTISRFTTFTYANGAKVIQIDADINRGNSGGPLITEEGYVIGLNTWGVGNEDGTVNLALEVDYVIDSLNDLIDTGVLQGFTYTLIDDRTPPVPTSPTTPSEEPPVVTTPDTTPKDTTPAETNSGDDQDSDDNMVIWLIAGAGVLILALILVLVLKNRKPKTKYPPVNQTYPEPPVSSGPAYTPTVPGDPYTPTMPGDPVAPQSNVYLVGVSGVYAGRKISISKPISMGRNTACDISFPDGTPGVSGMHCQVSPSGSGIVLMDIGSSMGTYLSNGTTATRNQPYTLNNGDMFYLGGKGQGFRVEIAGAGGHTAPAAASYHVVCTGGELAGKRYSLSGSLTLGRSPSCGIVYSANASGISSKHCSLSARSNGVTLTDLGSTYGTFLANGTKLSPNSAVTLRSGDSFYVGSRKNTFRIE